MSADKKPLTNLFVQKVGPTDRQQEIRDHGAPGLYLLVQATGAKSWACRYSRGGTVKKATLGGYPAIPLAEARRLALGLAGDVARGADPQA
ncbi:MAG: DUF4102 domain-containing protein, partial [Hyphomicrobiales bacterium]|nr:DUF4102 domain-containing protein [Hyphomicrobiales bacterium]